MILENKRARLVPFNQNAANQLKEIIFNDIIWKYMGHYIRSEKDFQEYVMSTLKAREAQTQIPFLIIDKNSETIAGSTRFGKIDLNNKRAEIGWTWYGVAFQGTGLNHEVKKLMLNYAFNTLQLNRIQLGTDLRNIRSQKAIEKLGATKEGIRRNHYIDSEGKVCDDFYYSITKEDWYKK